MAVNDEQQGGAEQLSGPKLMAERIGSARREAGYRTAQDFAEDLEVSVWTVRSWESGKSQPRYDVLREISRLTSRPIGWFLEETASQPGVERAIGRILEQYQLRAEHRTDADALEPGVYGIAAFDAAAERELQALSADARAWGLLIRLTKPAAPATAEQLATLHLTLATLLATGAATSPPP